MGIVRSEIFLRNSDDVAFAHGGFIPKEKIREMNLFALVDSGAEMLCLPEAVALQLGLKKLGETTAQLADGQVISVNLVGPVDLHILNRINVVMGMVLPNSNEVLLGAIPLQGMDLMIDLKNESLVLPPDRPYLAQVLLK